MSKEETVRSVQILLVEDNPGDVRLTREAFKDSKVKNEIVVDSDREAALAILRGANIEHRSFRPDLVLLDLNLPKLDGR